MAIISLSGVGVVTWGEPYKGQTIHEGENLLLTLDQTLDQTKDQTLANEDVFKAVGQLYLEIGGDSKIEDIADIAGKLSGISIRFPSFADGRGFSLAVRLRRDLSFKGEIRACGHVIPDQALFLLRAGFDSAVVPDERVTAFEKALSRYGAFYQTDVRGVLSAAHNRHLNPKEEKAAS